MNRRGFLGAMLAAGVAPAVVKAANIMPVFARAGSGLLVPSSLIGAGFLREVIAYDVIEDRFFGRWDVAARGGLQQTVTQEIGGPPQYTQCSAGLNGYRAVARAELEKALRQHGIQGRDLVTLQLPKGVHFARQI